MSVRTIFLAVRGIDQTGRAFSVIDRRIEKLIQRQMELGAKTRTAAMKIVKDQNKILFTLRAIDRASYRLIFAGAAFTGFAAMMGYAIMNIIEKSSMGQLYMEDFGRAWEKLSVSVSEAILENWGPSFQSLIEWLGELGQDPTFQMIVGKAAVPITIALAVMGVSMLVIGLIGKFLTLFITLAETMGWIESWSLSAAALGLKWVIPLTVVFLLTYVLHEALPEWYKEETALAKYKEWLETGKMWTPEYMETLAGRKTLIEKFIDWLTGGGGMPEPYAPKGGVGQLGTTRIPRTGLRFMHEGEYVFNPQLPISAPPQMMGRGGSPIIINVNQRIDSIGVEADEDRLADKTAERIGDKITELLG